jgi:ribosomal protein S18 acetylase RimI-like enzyme
MFVRCRKYSGDLLGSSREHHSERLTRRGTSGPIPLIRGQSIGIGNDVAVIESRRARGENGVFRSHGPTLSLPTFTQSLSSPPMLRSAGSEDIAAIAELTVQAYLDGGHLSPRSPYISTLRDVTGRLDQTVVLEQDDAIVACVAALPHGHAMAEATQSGEWEFRYLAVNQDYWGSGLGTRLVNAVEDRARAAGAETVVLRVVDDNPRAKRLYEYLGYHHQPQRDISFESSTDPSRIINLLLYAKAL